MKLDEIKELILTLDKTNINKFHIEMDNLKMSIEKEDLKEAIKKSSIEEENKNIEENIKISKDEKEDEKIHIINAPLMGTFYSSSSPDNPPYVTIGTKVKEGDTLCILEAMKLMNEIVCELNGEIIDILVKNEDLVEYGQPLFKVKID